MKFWILNDEGEPVEACAGAADAWRYGEGKDKVGVALTILHDGTEFTTIFVGLDMCDGSGPIMWQTMVIAGPHLGRESRHAGKAEAMAGHAEMLRQLSGSQPEANGEATCQTRR